METRAGIGGVQPQAGVRKRREGASPPLDWGARPVRPPSQTSGLQS